MKLIHRLAYYLGGFVIGLIILFFFLGGKDASCDYSPNARTLKNIRLKKREFNPKTLQTLQSKGLDTAAISSILNNGNVLFSESNRDLDSCKQYVIEGEIKETLLKITMENCAEVARLLDVNFQQE
ncbi:hypothetical protein [Patiriisocius hiemis]|uniref:DUF4258 domain-containing protein n=1 Tax=Patiriisocius hiemis TaxID=3075604 RepID=A0ABU2Y9N1_9FLAO|nr:hypothetical protein [Constantimarinum sp. W242]MDT0554889.1 hypothetical protein [Constantimarinum sp. W242]